MDKPLSERVAEYVANIHADVWRMEEIIRNQQALIEEWERKSANWFASPEAAQQLDGYRELAMRACKAEEERDRLRAENEALRKALVGLVGASEPAELHAMELAVRMLPAPDEDKVATINAIHALLSSAARSQP